MLFRWVDCVHELKARRALSYEARLLLVLLIHLFNLLLILRLILIFWGWLESGRRKFRLLGRWGIIVLAVWHLNWSMELDINQCFLAGLIQKNELLGWAFLDMLIALLWLFGWTTGIGLRVIVYLHWILNIVVFLLGRLGRLSKLILLSFISEQRCLLVYVFWVRILSGVSKSLHWKLWLRSNMILVYWLILCWDYRSKTTSINFLCWKWAWYFYSWWRAWWLRDHNIWISPIIVVKYHDGLASTRWR